MTAELSLRTTPTRSRGQRTIERLLTAADELLAAENEPVFGTRELAAVAGVSVGTVYTWFPHKEAIAEALALRYWQELVDLVAGVADATEQGTVADPARETLAVLVAGFRARPGFLALWFGPLRTELLRDAVRPYRVEVAGSIARMLRTLAPEVSDERLATTAQMAVLLGDGLLREAFRRDRTGDPTILAEGALALQAYITTSLQEPS